MPVYVFGEIDTRSSDIPVAAGDKNAATPPLLYFVMEFIGGTDVDQMIRQQGRLPPGHALAKSGIKPPSRYAATSMPSSPRRSCRPEEKAAPRSRSSCCRRSR